MPLALAVELPKSLTELAVERIRGAIVDGSLELGQMISEAALATAFGISKTPVREALMRLQAEGLVVIQPRRGTFVFEVDERELAEICDCRTTLEVAALRLAAKQQGVELARALSAIVERMGEAREAGDAVAYRRLDSAFHQAFFECCGNRYLADAYQLIAGKLAALRTRLSSSREHTEKSYLEHIRITELIASGDLNEALAVLEGHIGRRRGSYWMTRDALGEHQG